MARAKLLRGRAIKQLRPHAGRNHIHLLFWNSVLDKPLPQLRRYGGNMIGENRSEPVQSACDPVCEPGRADKAVSRQFVRHKVNGIVKQRTAGHPFCYYPDQRGFIIVRVNDVDPFPVDDTAKQLQQFEIKQKFLRRRSDFGVRLGPKRCRPVNLRVADADVFLSRGIGHDVDGVAHLRESIRHLSDTCRRAVIGREWACGDHGDGVAFGPIPSIWRSLSHVVMTGDLRYGLTVCREMIRAGTPITVHPLGTSLSTREFAPMTTLSPILTSPITLDPAPK